MELFQGSLPTFVDSAKSGQIANLLVHAYSEWYGRPPDEAEVRAWNNSLVRLKDVLDGSVSADTGISLEYELPLSSLRLDCMVTGCNAHHEQSAEIVELKQWESCKPTDEDDLVITYVKGRNRPVLHPSAQVSRYQQFLHDGNEAFYGDTPVRLTSCSYLHNYRLHPEDPLTAIKFERLRAKHPIFTADDFTKLRHRLREHAGHGEGMGVLNRIRTSRVAPSKQFLKHVGKVLKGIPEYTLLDEQVVTFQSILRLASSRAGGQSKHCVIVKGGPGTGKSVIAVNLLAELSKRGFNTRYATGSRAFTTTLRKIAGTRAASQFDYTLSYSNAAENQLDLLIVDEAHRIRQTTASRWTPRSERSRKPQVEELLRAARVAVFFIDDLQAVRPDEIGTSGYIAEQSDRLNIPRTEFELDIQFRCQGSDRFVSWIDSLLGLKQSLPSNYHVEQNFDLRIFETPRELESELRARTSEGATARMTAGFCWPWSDPNVDGTLVDDVRIGDYIRPWNAKPDVGKVSGGVPRASLWAFSDTGVNQIGCVYSVQGFDFDYVGVIVGPDLTVGRDGSLVGNPNFSEDSVIKRSGDKAATLIARTYRVLFSRGMKGCYVTFTDPRVREIFESHLVKH